VLMTVWKAGWDVPSHPAYQTVIIIEWQIPGVALIQKILLMMGTWRQKHVENRNKAYKGKLCTTLIVFTRLIQEICTSLVYIVNYTTMHGAKNIKICHIYKILC
jgi:hypothetical protein